MKQLTALVVASALMLNACSSKPDASFIDQVQDAATRACGFVPLAATILAILGLHDSALMSAQQIADAICQKVGEAARTRTAPVLKGIPIEGHRAQP